VNEMLDRDFNVSGLTIAVHTESAELEPLIQGASSCLYIQIGEIFNAHFLPFDDEVDMMPPIGPNEAFIIFCVNPDGTPNYSPITEILAPFFANEEILIVTFDCAKDLFNLETVGIYLQSDAYVMDCQLFGLPVGIEYLKYTPVNTLAYRIECMDISDPFLRNAQLNAPHVKTIRWDAKAFVIREDNLPITAAVTKELLEYAANQVSLIGLAPAEVVLENAMESVLSQTNAKRDEYDGARNDFGPLGPFLVRQAALADEDIFSLKASDAVVDDTERLLARWRKLRQLSTVLSSARELLTVDALSADLPQMLEETERRLRQPANAIEVRILAGLVHSPGSHTAD
jgi:hypothetical protein